VVSAHDAREDAGGVFREGQHFFQPTGCQPRWKWEAVVASPWLVAERLERTEAEVVR
jgi:hypothetical protein